MLAEHHFQHEGYEVIPNILMVAVHLAHVTKRLKTGCGFNITPMWHPLRLAEDFATADILTKGRTIRGRLTRGVPRRRYIRLRRQVEDALRLYLAEQLVHRRGVAEVAFAQLDGVLEVCNVLAGRAPAAGADHFNR